jgi:hypothetical protein
VPGLQPAVGEGGLQPDIVLDVQTGAIQVDVYIQAAVEALLKETK